MNKKRSSVKIWANTIVHNEENFIWFSIMSVIDYVDKVIVWDTGSTDKTVEIIKEIIKEKGEKIEFKEVGSTDENEFTVMRQAMLDKSNSDWILVLDGDEIWWQNSIKKVITEINLNGSKINGIVVPMIVPVGDIFHIQDENAGQYELLGKKGHLSLRFINKKIPGLYVDWPYGKESFFNKNKKPIQEIERIVYIEAPYLHVTHLKRSSKNRGLNKFKFELGNRISNSFRFPEVMSYKYPTLVTTPWNNITGTDLVKAKILTPLRKIKRRIRVNV